MGTENAGRASPISQEEAARRLSALGHPVRIKIIVAIVASGPAGIQAGELSSAVGISPALLSSHVRILEHASLISRERRGRATICRVQTERCREASRFIACLA